VQREVFPKRRPKHLKVTLTPTPTLTLTPTPTRTLTPTRTRTPCARGGHPTYQVDTAHGPVVASLHAVLLVSASLPPERCARVRSEAAGDEAALQRELDREIEVLPPEPGPKPDPQP
jgi:hypothetical protein